MSISEKPSITMLRDARRQFGKLLEYPHIPEREWQSLFSTFPFILSEALPLKLSPFNIQAKARPGKSEPDFIFYPKRQNAYPQYGVIELKKSTDKIITIPRKNIITLSRSAATAIHQAKSYLLDLSGKLINTNNAVILGGSSYIFIIMGLSQELEIKIVSSILSESFRQAIPVGCEIIPYDILFKRFEEAMHPQFLLLTPYFGDPDELIRNEIEIIQSVTAKLGRQLLIEGINSNDPAQELNVAGRMRVDKHIRQTKGDRCIFVLEDIWDREDYYTTHMAIDILAFSKRDLFRAFQSGYENKSIVILGNRHYDKGLWDDSLPSFETKDIQNIEIQLKIDLHDFDITVEYDQKG